MSELSERFLPEPSPATQPFWDGCLQGELRLQHCDDCGHWQFYPRIFCTACGARDLQWQTASGRGTLRSFTLVQRPVSAAYAADVPYAVILVALSEGPTIMSQLTAIDLKLPGAQSQLQIGAPLKVRFVPWSETIHMPLFELE